tara:strand:- start:8119 stop:8631 length:513 start_codon:yes stop_codon:yes gene_type:complete
MMKSTFWQRCDGLARAVSPFAITFLLVLFMVVPQRSATLAPVMPALTMAAVYYWTVFRPDLMPLGAIFLIGLFEDLLLAAPLGLGTMTLLLIYLVVATQRRFFAVANFLLLWVSFALISAPVMLLNWLLASLLLENVLPLGPVVLKYFTTIAIYPFLAWLFGRAQQAFLR